MLLTTTTTEIENIGDIIEIHMSHLATMCSMNHVTFNEEDLQFLKFPWQGSESVRFGAVGG